MQVLSRLIGKNGIITDAVSAEIFKTAKRRQFDRGQLLPVPFKENLQNIPIAGLSASFKTGQGRETA